MITNSPAAPTLDPVRDLAPVLADLDLDPERLHVVEDLAAEDESGPRGSADLFAVARTKSPETGPGQRVRDLAAHALAPDGALLLLVEGEPTDDELAAWRNALWPSVHVFALYRLAGGKARRQLLQGTTELEGATGRTGVVLAARLREHALSPEATVEKFDLNAAGWNGEPGSPGYPHFRWMRRYVGAFAHAAPGARILDFGCGAGWVGIEAARRCPDATLHAFDPSPQMVKIAAENARASGLGKVDVRTGFGEEPPFPPPGEAPYDLVISSGVVSFAPDVERWLDGLASTVAPGGRLVIGDLNRDSRGNRARRRTRPLLPIRELNALTRAQARRLLEARGFTHEASAGYQLTFPMPQAMALSERRLKGLLSRPLLWTNRAATAVDKAFGARAPDAFDSWVMRLVAPGG